MECEEKNREGKVEKDEIEVGVWNKIKERGGGMKRRNRVAGMWKGSIAKVDMEQLKEAEG